MRDEGSKIFASEYAPRLWDRLYTVRIPDHLTLNDAYHRQRGTYTSRDPRYAEMMATNVTTVKITVMRMLKYYTEGITVMIPSREDMIQIHEDIESYLSEWREHIATAINLDTSKYTKMLLDLEKMSKVIYEKTSMSELTAISKKDTPSFGLTSPLSRIQGPKSPSKDKPEYDSISKLLRGRNGERLNRF